METKTTLYIFGGVVLLLLIYLGSRSSGSSSGAAWNLQVVGQSPEMASIGAQTRIAEIGATSQLYSDFFDFLLGSEQTKSAESLGKYQTDASVAITNSNNVLAEKVGLAAIDRQKNADNLAANTSNYLGELNLRGVEQTQRTARTQARWNGAGNIFGSIFGGLGDIFGF